MTRPADATPMRLCGPRYGCRKWFHLSVMRHPDDCDWLLCPKCYKRFKDKGDAGI